MRQEQGENDKDDVDAMFGFSDDEEDDFTFDEAELKHIEELERYEAGLRRAASGEEAWSSSLSSSLSPSPSSSPASSSPLETSSSEVMTMGRQQQQDRKEEGRDHKGGPAGGIGSGAAAGAVGAESTIGQPRSLDRKATSSSSVSSPNPASESTTDENDDERGEENRGSDNAPPLSSISPSKRPYLVPAAGSGNPSSGGLGSLDSWGW